jgi:outer membrane protein assembly factor BamB
MSSWLYRGQRPESLLVTVLFMACAACSASISRVAKPMGVVAFTDNSVTPFRADKVATWNQFRLGGGLNVVVVNPRLPRAVRWRSHAGSIQSEGISSSPVVYRNLVLVTSNDDALYAIDAASGRLRWRYFGSNELMTQPVYDGHIVIVASGNGGCLICFYPRYTTGGTGLSQIYAVDVRTGKEVWRQTIEGSGMPTAALVGSDVIHADGSGAILALNAQTGGFQWATRVASAFKMSAVLDGGDGRIYVRVRSQQRCMHLARTTAALSGSRRFRSIIKAPKTDR